VARSPANPLSSFLSRVFLSLHFLKLSEESGVCILGSSLSERQTQRVNTKKAMVMNRRMVLLIVASVIVIVSSTVGVYLLTRVQEATKPPWLKVGAFVTYEQFFVWTGNNATEYMTWNITRLENDYADLHLISHGVDTPGGNVIITTGEVNWTLNAATREILSASDSNYVGEKNPFWIEKVVTTGYTIDILYGANTISKSESVNVLGQQRDCWVVEYQWPTSTLKRWYDKPSGIVLKIQVVLYRQDLTIEITETALQTNVDLES